MKHDPSHVTHPYFTHGYPDLLYYIDAVVDLLSLQEGMEMVEEGTEVGLPVPVRHHYRCVVTGLAVWGAVASTWHHQRIPLSDLLQRQRGGEVDGHRSDWRRGKGKRLILIVWL